MIPWHCVALYKMTKDAASGTTCANSTSIWVGTFGSSGAIAGNAPLHYPDSCH